MAQFFSARVRNGVIDTGGVDLPEGAVVTVVVEDDDQREHDLTAEEEAELAASLADADRGEGIPADELLRQLRDAR